MSSHSPIRSEPATGRSTPDTQVGSVFVSNYPPYSFWGDSAVPDAKKVLEQDYDPAEGTDLGLYMHIPFCRKRCKFCYFRVYTDRNASQIHTYLDGLASEIEMYSRKPRIQGRPLRFVYFGGGTPSYISAKQLTSLVDRVKAVMPWDGAEEVAFECEPGTLSRTKLEVIREIGVTRLSLGVENLNDAILEENGRAHLSKEIFDVWPWIRDIGFPQVNVDLIAGMVGETWDTWKDTVQRTVDLDADSVTIYQMELPFNTVYSKTILSEEGNPIPVADWNLKREWNEFALESFLGGGRDLSRDYTLSKKGRKTTFVYRDALWESADMLGTGVASISHMAGIHYQNDHSWDGYLGGLEKGQLPVTRAFLPTESERITRELVLQMKLGRLDTGYFSSKFGINIEEKYADAFDRLASEEYLTRENGAITLTRSGLLRVDQLLPNFYDEKYQNARYT